MKLKRLIERSRFGFSNTMIHVDPQVESKEKDFKLSNSWTVNQCFLFGFMGHPRFHRLFRIPLPPKPIFPCIGATHHVG